MSIARRTQLARKENSSFLHEQKQLILFTNRAIPTRVFTDYMYDDNKPGQIIFFHGDGGNGKSLLLKYFLKFFCRKLKRSKDWDHCKGMDDKERQKHLETLDDQSFVKIPHAFLDFGQKGIDGVDNNRPQDSYSALRSLHKQLVTYNIRFPLYEYASFRYLEKTGQLNQAAIQDLFPEKEMGMAINIFKELLEIVVEVNTGGIASIIIPTLGVLNKRAKKAWKLRCLRSKITEKRLDNIETMDPETELLPELPIFFADDLNAAIYSGNHEGIGNKNFTRIVLLFDTHEAFWKDNRYTSNELYFEKDKWFRILLNNLNLHDGIVPVVAGREVPQWHRALREKIEAIDIDVHFVGALSSVDGDEYLRKAGIEDSKLRESILQYVQVGQNELHPFFLALCVEIIITAKELGQPMSAEEFSGDAALPEKKRELVERFLRYILPDIKEAIIALSACRGFDEKLFYYLGQQRHFKADHATFKHISEYSFVNNIGKSKEKRIHRLLREIVGEVEEYKELVEEAHQTLFDYYRDLVDKGNRNAVVDSVYHLYRLDKEQGVQEWLKNYAEEIEFSRWHDCRALNEIVNEFRILTDLQMGKIYLIQSGYYYRLSQYFETVESCTLAVNKFEKVLEEDALEMAALNGKAEALTRQGEVYATHSKNLEAEKCYQLALKTVEVSLKIDCEYSHAYLARGNTLTRLGTLQAGFSHNIEAEENYQMALESFEDALKINADRVKVFNSKGNTLIRLGELRASFSQNQKAENYYQQALEAFERTIEIEPNNASAINGIGRALIQLGYIQTRTAQYLKAERNYQSAIGVLNQVLELAPENILVIGQKSEALLRLGELQDTTSRTREAETTFLQAVDTIELLVKLTPDNVDANIRKAHLHVLLGKLRTTPSREVESKQNFLQALTTLEHVFELSPENVHACEIKGDALLRLGELQTNSSKTEEVEETYRQALDAVNRALEQANKNVYSYILKGHILIKQGELQDNTARIKNGEEKYRLALEAASRALELASENAYAFLIKGYAFLRLGELFQTLEAEIFCRQAVEAVKRALDVRPEFVYAYLIKGGALLRLGELQTSESRRKELYQQALETINQALIIDPNSRAAITEKQNIIYKIAP